MAKYLKLFETTSEYNTYINGDDKILPNVSLCEDNNEVHYNPFIDTRIIAKFNVTSTTEMTWIVSSESDNLDNFLVKVEIDDGTVIEGDDLVDEYGLDYTFSTLGEHTVYYTLIDPTTLEYYMFQECENLISVTIPNSVASIANGAFYRCSGLTSVTIPNSVTSIGNSTFYGCSSLTSIIIPENVTSIDGWAFNGCSNLISVTVKTTTPPYIGEEVFESNASGRKIYVPSASVDAYKAASGWSDYANDIEAIPTT